MNQIISTADIPFRYSYLHTHKINILAHGAHKSDHIYIYYLSQPPIMAYYSESSRRTGRTAGDGLIRSDWHWESVGCLCAVMLRSITCAIKHFLAVNCLCEVMSGSGSEGWKSKRYVHDWANSKSNAVGVDFTRSIVFPGRAFVTRRWKPNGLCFVEVVWMFCRRLDHFYIS